MVRYLHIELDDDEDYGGFEQNRNPVVKFLSDKLSTFLCWKSNTLEKCSHIKWNMKRTNRVECCICGDVLTSEEKNSPSPDECGWIMGNRHGFKRWFCHRCVEHRDFSPYIELVDIDESIMWKEGGWQGDGIPLEDDRQKKIDILKGMIEEIVYGAVTWRLRSWIYKGDNGYPREI